MVGQFKLFRIFVLAVALFAWHPAIHAQDAAESDNDTPHILEILNSGEDLGLNAKKLLAERFSNRSKYLDLSYVEPDDEDLNAGWNAKYNFNYSKSSENGFSAESERFELDAYSVELDIKGSYSFDDAANPDDLSSATVSLSYLNVDLGKLEPVSKEEGRAVQRWCFGVVKNPRPEDFEINGEIDRKAFDDAAEEVKRLREVCKKAHL